MQAHGKVEQSLVCLQNIDKHNNIELLNYRLKPDEVDKTIVTNST